MNAEDASIVETSAPGRQPWIILVTHGHLGLELQASVEMIVGPIEDMYCLSLMPGMDPMDLRKDLAELLENAPDKTIIFTDLFGGSPSNIAATFTGDNRFTIICGVNLPMVVEAVIGRMAGRYDLGDSLVQIGQEAVKDIGKAMAERRKKC